MKLADIFSSRAKVLTVEILHVSSRLRLRQIAHLADIHVRSVELALRELIFQNIVIKRRSEEGSIYRLNANNIDCLAVIELLSYHQSELVKRRSKIYATKAKASIDFQTAIHGLFSRIRRG